MAEKRGKTVPLTGLDWDFFAVKIDNGAHYTDGSEKNSVATFFDGRGSGNGGDVSGIFKIHSESAVLFPGIRKYHDGARF